MSLDQFPAMQRKEGKAGRSSRGNKQMTAPFSSAQHPCPVPLLLAVDPTRHSQSSLRIDAYGPHVFITNS